MSDLISRLHWRYAAKRMNGHTIPQEKLDIILESINLAPTSVGLQPFNVLLLERCGDFPPILHRKDTAEGLTPGLGRK